jgi:hypothetical protein
MSLDLIHKLAPFGSDDGATFGTDRRHRYHLWRSWASREHRCVFVMLNPSKADEQDGDLTVTKCATFARSWGFGALDVVNLFALVSTDPTALERAAYADAVGPENDATIVNVVANAHRIVWAWGSHTRRVNELVATRRRELLTLLGTGLPRPHPENGTLGKTQDGSPRHPSRLAYATRFEAI